MHRQEFREIASIGQGNFSKVFRVKSKFDGMEYALKRSFRSVSSELEAKRWQQVGLHCLMTVYVSTETPVVTHPYGSPMGLFSCPQDVLCALV